MIAELRNLLRGGLLAAPFSMPGVVTAQETMSPRVDIIGCVKAVEHIDDVMRPLMQNQCAVIAASLCETSRTVAPLACLEELSEAMRSYVARGLAVLPDEIEGGGFEERRYTRTLAQLGSETGEAAACASQYDAALNRAVCVMAAEYGHVLRLVGAARSAGVDLP